MWSPGCSSFLLFLLLELSPQPGDSQGAHLLKHCKECKKILKEKDIKQNFYQILVDRANFTVCPDDIIRFTLPRDIYCGNRIESWVDKVIKCIQEGRIPCLQPTENQNDFSKGSNKKPPTTTQEPTTSTTKTAPSLRLSTQTWKGGTSNPSEITREEFGTTQKIQQTTIGLTAAPESDQNNDLLQGHERPNEKSDEKSKMKQMSIAIISLILIVLVFSAVGTYFGCRKAKFTNCTERCVVETVKYQPTPLDEIESGP